MANRKDLDILRSGIEAWNKWREQVARGVWYEHNTTAKVALASDGYQKIPANCPDLSNVQFVDTDLQGINLKGAYLRRTWFWKTNLQGANLESAYITDGLLHSANLSKANLAHAFCVGANFVGASLRGSDMSGATMSGVNCFAADLTDAVLEHANLESVDFGRAILERTKLTKANLSGVEFYQTRMQNADLTGATCSFSGRSTRFNDVDLSEVKGLESVVHYEPSCIDVATLFRSGRSVCVQFFREAGVPESLLRVLPEMLRDGAVGGSTFEDIVKEIRNGR